MNWYKQAKQQDKQKSQELFRGDENPINIEDYDHEYASKVLGKELASSMSNGPGIYFTVTEENAQFYGQNITKRTIQNANIITEQTRKFNYNQLEKFIRGINKERVEIAISNWDENYNNGKKMLIESIMNADNATGQLMLIWSDIFFHQDPNAFIQLMVNNGIDGIAVTIPNAATNQNDTHYIIYNKSVLK